MFVRVLLLLGICCVVWPGNLSAESRAERGRRGEASACVSEILAGRSIHANVSRLKYLGEEPYAARALGHAFGGLLEPAIRREVLSALAFLSQPHSEALFLELTRDRDPVLRMYAAKGLGLLRSRRAAALLPLLQDASPGVRREAAWAIGACRPRAASRSLLKAARLEGEPEVREAMLAAVGELREARAARSLSAFLQHSSESTRLAAAKSLCRIGSKEGLRFAAQRLHSAVASERLIGVSLLAGTQLAAARPLLSPRLSDADRSVAAAAAGALYRCGDLSMLRWLLQELQMAPEAEKRVYEQQLEALGITDEQRRAALQDARRPSAPDEGQPIR